MEVVESKIVAGVIIFLATLLSGVLPYMLFRRAAARASVITEVLQDIMQAFACGVFIATCLLYLVPEAEHSISHAVDSDLPVAMIIIAMGVLLTLFLEHAFILYSERSQKGSTIAFAGHHHHHHQPQHHHQKKSTEFHNGVLTKSDPSSDRSEKTSPMATTYHNYGSVDDLVDGSLGHGKEHTMLVSENGVIPVSIDEKNPLLFVDKDGTAFLPEDKRTGSTTSNKTTSSTAKQAEIIDDNLDIVSKNETSAKMKESVLRSVVLILALSFHTVFDGLVVGVQDTEAEVWTLLAAITLHKALEAISISLSLVDSHGQHPRSTFLYLFLFSLVSPLGLAIGTALTESNIDEEAQNLASGILQSIAAGTFMYATFVESMKDRYEGRFRLLKVLVTVFGFACVCMVRLFTKDHSH